MRRCRRGDERLSHSHVGAQLSMLSRLLLVCSIAGLVGAFSAPSPRCVSACRRSIAHRMQEEPPAEQAAEAAPEVAAPEVSDAPGTGNQVKGLDYGEYENPMTSWNPNAPPEDMDKVREALAKPKAYFDLAAKGKEDSAGFEAESGAVQFLVALVAVGAAATLVFTPQAFGQ